MAYQQHLWYAIPLKNKEDVKHIVEQIKKALSFQK